ncbi:MAG: thioredoxin-dependent thiol peroxidase [Candidatus Zixiibacteriota bacterium]|nr:MAG: thioredoxin-dependent thiol peroxidase [candidate division Zixibacteria bacterium]
MMPEVGKKAPDFTLKDQDGVKRKLSDYRGKPVVLYFYPRDDTPGCTTEACSFRDNFGMFKRMGIEVLGISIDDEKSHMKFRERYNLPFTLLADPDKKAMEKYGVWVEKNMYGKKKWGTARKTFLIDEDGKIKHIFNKVKTDIHAHEVLDVMSG